MARMSKAEIRRHVYGAISAWLMREVQIDTDDSDFHDAVWPVQKEMAEKFAKKAGGK